jgi:hypothetical protein
MKILKIALAAYIATAMAVPAGANLRMARKVDGVVSGSLKAVPASLHLRLMGERLDVSFPRLGLSSADPRSPVWFRITYEIENPGPATPAVPLRFLAVDISGLTVELNGKPVGVTVKAAPEEGVESTALLVRHRAAFLPVFYEDFLARLRALQEKGGGGPPWREAFTRTFEEVKTDEPSAADFEVVLPPGRSRLIVDYGQRLFIDERGHGYFAAWPKKGVTGFDYLLYPAKAWPTDPGFKLAVSIAVPEAAGKKLFFNVYKKPSVKANLPLREVPGCAWGNGSTYKGEFTGGMPADVLTFLIWFDDAAAGYLK